MKILFRVLTLVCFQVVATAVYAQPFFRLDSTINALIDSNKVSGGEALVWHAGNVVHHKAYGWKDAAKKEVMDTGLIYRIASQTKLITTIAALQLIDKNRIDLDAPIARWIPAFADQSVARLEGNEIKLVGRIRPITLRHLLSHTSGISSVDEAKDFSALFKQYRLDQPLNFSYPTLEAEVDQLAKMPLVHQPGERFSYGVSTDVLARWVEVVSGIKFGSYLKKYIFDPLNMTDTYFKLPASKKDRLLSVHVTGPGGRLIPLGNQFFPIDFPLRDDITLESGSGGLVSTGADYLKLLTCLINDGKYGKNEHLLSGQWIDSLCTGQLAGETFSTGGVRSKNTFGLGVGVTTLAGSATSGISVGSFFWGGAFNTSYVVDRNQKTITIFLFQRAPFDMGRNLSILERMAFQDIKGKN